MSVDPLISNYHWYTPYQYAGNKPIWSLDLDGLEDYLTMDYWAEKISSGASTIKKVSSSTIDYLSNTKITLETKSSIGIQAGFKADLLLGTPKSKVKVEAKANLFSVNITNAKLSASKNGIKDETTSMGDGVKIEQELNAGIQISQLLKIKSGVKQEFSPGACPGCQAGTGSHNNKVTVSNELKIGNYVSVGREHTNETSRYDENGNQLPDKVEDNTTVKPDLGKIFGLDLDASFLLGVKIDLKIKLPDAVDTPTPKTGTE